MVKKSKEYHSNVVVRNPDGSISHRNRSSCVQNDKGSTNIATHKKKKPVFKINMFSEFSEGKVILDLPLQTISEANCFEHWTKKHKRHREQRRIVSFALKPLREKIKLPCNILLTRLAPHKLDKHDNLPMSMKYIVDAVCAIITGNFQAGKADSDERISIAYDQIQNKEYGVKIEITYS